MKEKWHNTILGYIFNQHPSVPLDDFSTVLEAKQIDFSVLGPLSCIDSGSATLSYPPFSSQWAEVSTKEKKKSLNLRRNAVWPERAKQCMYTEWGTHSSASSIKVKTLFAECLSYWLCIRLITRTLCCTGVARGFSQHAEQPWDEKSATADFGESSGMMFKSLVCLDLLLSMLINEKKILFFNQSCCLTPKLTASVLYFCCFCSLVCFLYHLEKL